MGGVEDHHVKQNKPGPEKQTSHVFSHIQNLSLHKIKTWKQKEDEQDQWNGGERAGEYYEVIKIKMHDIYAWQCHNEIQHFVQWICYYKRHTSTKKHGKLIK